MKQPIAGVTPPELKEAVIMTVWPSIAALSEGRMFGRLYQIRWGWGIATVGNLIALLSIPLVLPLFLSRFAFGVTKELPWGLGKIIPVPNRLMMRRYVLTNRRVLVQRGLTPVDEAWVELDRFDTIDIEVLPGQDWYPAGNLIFRRGTVETFRLDGVPRPETFRQTCLKAHIGYVGVQKTLG